MEGYIGKVKLSNILFNDATCVYTYTHMCVCMHRVSRVDRRSSISQDQVVPTFRRALFWIRMLSRFKERRRVTISKCVVVNLRANELRVSRGRKQFTPGYTPRSIISK